MNYNKIIEKNTPLVRKIIKDMFRVNNANEYDRYLQAGRIAIWKASKKYDSSYGSKFSSFVYQKIIWEILNEIREDRRYHCQKLNECSTKIKDCFWEYLPNLSMQERIILSLRLQKFTLNEIVKKINIPFYKVVKINKSVQKKIKINNA